MQKITSAGLVAVLIAALLFGFIGGVLGSRWAGSPAVQAAAPTRATVLGQLPNSFGPVVAAVTPSVVNIDTVSYQRQESPFPFFEDQLYRRTGGGSGFIVSADGMIVTNDHVVENASQITVSLADGRKFQARVVGADRVSDLAVLKIDAANLPAAPLGNSSAIEPGDWAIAIGNPFGFDHTVTVGVISALGRPIRVSNRLYPNLIQTDALINQGNSGGPLLNSAGEVIGITTVIFAAGPAPAPIGFAIPINDAKQVVKELSAKGRVSRAWIGVSLTNVTPQLAGAYHLPVQQGVIVTRTVEGGPAEQAGLQRLDLIESMDGKTVTDRSQLLYDINTARPGTVLKLQVWRPTDEGTWNKATINVRTVEMPQE